MTSTMSTISTTPKEYVGKSGRVYKVEKVIQEEEEFPPRRVYLATANNRKFILKYIHEVNYDYLQDLNNKLRDGPTRVRLTQDTVPEQSMFVFDYFKDHLLHLAQKDLSTKTRKKILKDALEGITELHDRNIVHTDIKPDNIFIDWESDKNGITINRVQIGDLEDAAYIPPGSAMIGKQAGNWMWRSPEAHASGPIEKPSDIFSFALVCIYAMRRIVILAVSDDELEEGIERIAIVIERQISYFGDLDGLDGLFKYLGDNPWVRVFEVTRDGFNKENPRRPFALLKDVDDDFKSLISAMTNFDPEKRITAREALKHKWFEGV